MGKLLEGVPGLMHHALVAQESGEVGIGENVVDRLRLAIHHNLPAHEPDAVAVVGPGGDVTRVKRLDRLLDGPTSAVWINPWVRYLTQLGVRFGQHLDVEGIDTALAELRAEDGT